jgi:hypothetical protein
VSGIPRFFVVLILGNRAHRAGCRAAAAVDAGIRVDYVLFISGGYAGHRAIGGACAAAYAVRTDYMGH